MNRIEKQFDELRRKGAKAFISFITAGDPDLRTTLDLVLEFARDGVDIIELGVPFSDPLADGPTIQRASARALKHGTSLRQVLGFVADFRKTNGTTPVVLMGYANPVEAMGHALF